MVGSDVKTCFLGYERLRRLEKVCIGSLVVPILMYPNTKCNKIHFWEGRLIIGYYREQEESVEFSLHERIIVNARPFGCVLAQVLAGIPERITYQSLQY